MTPESNQRKFAPVVVIRCVYTDLDGTLLGTDGSLMHDADGNWTNLPMRALQMGDVCAPG